MSALRYAEESASVSYDATHPHAPGVIVTTYWHAPEDGSPGYVVVEVSEFGKDAVPVLVRHNDGLAYDGRHVEGLCRRCGRSMTSAPVALFKAVTVPGSLLPQLEVTDQTGCADCSGNGRNLL